MAKLLPMRRALLAAALARLAGAGAPAPPCAGGVCVPTDDEQGLSMLQVQAGQAGQAGRRAAESPAESLAESPAVESVPSTTEFRGASMLIMQVPVTDKLKAQAMAPGLFGEPAFPRSRADPHTFWLDAADSVLLVITHFPDAAIGWSDAYGTSERVNLPHHLVSVKVPLWQGAQKIYQTEYALSDDDAAINIYRMGYGIPAKLANFSLPSGATPADMERFSVNRRGNEMLRVSGIKDVGEADKDELARLLERPEVTHGTGLFHNIVNTAVYHKHLSKAKIRQARKVDVDSLFVHGPLSTENLDVLLSSGKPVAAWRVDVDLTVTSSSVKVPRAFGTLPVLPRRTSTMWKMGGERWTDEPHDPYKFMAYQDGDVVWFTMKIDAEQVAPYLPPEMSLASDEAILWNVRWQPTDVTNMWGLTGAIMGHTVLEYNELWVNIPVEARGRRYLYPILMLLDDDVAQVTGRDTAGTPKKLANMTFTFSPRPQQGAEFKLDISHKGRLVMRASGQLAEKTFKPVPGVNANFEPDSTYAFVNTQQYMRDSGFYQPMWLGIHGVQRTHAQHGLANVAVELGSGAPEPLGRWFKGAPLQAGYVKMDQDWIPAMDSPLMASPVSQWGLQEWWKRCFAVMYM